MTSKGSKELAEWAASDPALAQKVALSKKMMLENSDVIMNDQYFADINA